MSSLEETWEIIRRVEKEIAVKKEMTERFDSTPYSGEARAYHLSHKGIKSEMSINYDEPRPRVIVKFYV